MTVRECKEIFAVLSEYLDGELPPDACDEIADHIDGCPPCVEFVESLRKTVDLCRNHKPDCDPPPLSAATREQLLAAYRKAFPPAG